MFTTIVSAFLAHQAIKEDHPTMDYYLHLHGEDRGPFTLSQLQNMWKAGTITKQTIFWTEGMVNWEPLLRIIRLLEPPTIPPAPPAVRQVVPAPKKTSTVTWIALIFVVVIIGAGMIGNCSTQKTQSAPPVNATVHRTAMAISVTNADSFDWPSLKLWLNGNPLTGYKYEHPYTVRSGETISVALNEFAHGEKRFNSFTMKPTDLIVYVAGYDAPTFHFR